MGYILKKGSLSARIGDTFVPVEAIVSDSNNSFNKIQEYLNDSNKKVDEMYSKRDALITSINSALSKGTDTSLTTSGVPADAKVTGDKLTQVKEDLTSLNDKTNKFVEDVFDKTETENLFEGGDITISAFTVESRNQSGFEVGKTYVMEAQTSIEDLDKYNVSVVGKGANGTNLFSGTYRGVPVEFTIPEGLQYVNFQLYHASTVTVVYSINVYEKPGSPYKIKFDALPNKLVKKQMQLIIGNPMHTAYVRGDMQPASASTYSIEYDVEEYDKLLLKLSPTAYYDAYTLLDASKSPISYKNNGSSTAYTEEAIDVPKNCKYLVVSGNPNTTLSTVKLFAEKEIINSDFCGKKIVWFGTSIPAGGLSGYENELSYPMMVGNKLGATVYNEAIGSSTVHCRRASYVKESNPYGFIEPFDAVARCLSNTLQMNEWVISHYSTFRNAPSSLSDADKDFIRSCSFERKLDKYLIPENEPDVWIFDHGHNDYLGDESTYSNANMYDCMTFRSAMNFLINRIREYNPRAKIIFLYDYDDKKYPNIVSNQRIVYDDWNFPSYELYKDLGWTNKTVKTTGRWIDGFWYPSGGSEQNISYIDLWCADGLHPHSDKSRHALEEIANKVSKYLSRTSI